jgi:hypothetical protein
MTDFASAVSDCHEWVTSVGSPAAALTTKPSGPATCEQRGGRQMHAPYKHSASSPPPPSSTRSCHDRRTAMPWLNRHSAAIISLPTQDYAHQVPLPPHISRNRQESQTSNHFYCSVGDDALRQQAHDNPLRNLAVPVLRIAKFQSVVYGQRRHEQKLVSNTGSSH